MRDLGQMVTDPEQNSIKVEIYQISKFVMALAYLRISAGIHLTNSAQAVQVVIQDRELPKEKC